MAGKGLGRARPRPRPGDWPGGRPGARRPPRGEVGSSSSHRCARKKRLDALRRPGSTTSIPKPGSTLSRWGSKSRAIARRRRVRARPGRWTGARARPSRRWKPSSKRRAPRPSASRRAHSTRGDIAGGPGQILRGADRLGEGQAREPGIGRPAEGQRLPASGPAPGPGGATTCGPKRRVIWSAAGRPRGRWWSVPGGRSGRRLRASRRSGGDRQRRQSVGLRSPWRRRWRRRGRNGPGPRPRRACPAIAARAGRPFAARRATRSAAIGRLAAPQVGDAGDVEEQAVRRIERHGRREPHAPVGQGGSSAARVGGRIGVGESTSSGTRAAASVAFWPTKSPSAAAPRPPPTAAARPARSRPGRGGPEALLSRRGGRIAASPVGDRPGRRPHAEDARHRSSP